MDVIAMDTAPAESASGSAPFPVALTVVIHSQVAIPNLQLRVKLDQAAFLSQGLQQWQGGIDAGETLRLSYVLESSADAESVRDKLCQFELYRMESGLRQWLSTADYALLKPGLATSAIRVPLQEQFADGVARLRHADGDPSSQRYLVEYPLD